jgi:phosphoribosylanthranilate isomerase
MLATELGAAAVGFVFWPGSPRFIDPGEARAIVEALPAFVIAVGVFVDQPEPDVVRIARALGLGAVQLHGSERPESYAAMPCRVIKAVHVADGMDAEAAVETVPDHATILLDAHDPARRGGTGQTIDWARAAALARRRPLILSGGLNQSNVRAAIATVRPYAIDVSSGVESAPGIKSATKLQALFAAVAQMNPKPVNPVNLVNP